MNEMKGWGHLFPGSKHTLFADCLQHFSSRDSSDVIILWERVPVGVEEPRGEWNKDMHRTPGLAGCTDARQYPALSFAQLTGELWQMLSPSLPSMKRLRAAFGGGVKRFPSLPAPGSSGSRGPAESSPSWWGMGCRGACRATAWAAAPCPAAPAACAAPSRRSAAPCAGEGALRTGTAGRTPARSLLPPGPGPGPARSVPGPGPGSARYPPAPGSPARLRQMRPVRGGPGSGGAHLQGAPCPEQPSPVPAGSSGTFHPLPGRLLKGRWCHQLPQLPVEGLGERTRSWWMAAVMLRARPAAPRGFQRGQGSAGESVPMLSVLGTWQACGRSVSRGALQRGQAAPRTAGRASRSCGARCPGASPAWFPRPGLFPADIQEIPAAPSSSWIISPSEPGCRSQRRRQRFESTRKAPRLPRETEYAGATKPGFR